MECTEECPASQPDHYDICCPPAHPVFNDRTKMCEACPHNKPGFNPNASGGSGRKGKCVASGDVKFFMSRDDVSTSPGEDLINSQLIPPGEQPSVSTKLIDPFYGDLMGMSGISTNKEQPSNFKEKHSSSYDELMSELSSNAEQSSATWTESSEYGYEEEVGNPNLSTLFHIIS